MRRPSVEQAAQNGYVSNAAPALSPDALRAEIAETRAALGGTAEALAERFDIPTRIRQRVRRVRVVRDRPTMVAAAIAVVGTIVAVWAFRRRR